MKEDDLYQLLPPNWEKRLYLKDGKFFLEPSAILGLLLFMNELVIEFLNFELIDLPNFSFPTSSDLK